MSRRLLLALPLAALASGCTPIVYAVTPAPPAHQASFVGDDGKGHDQIVLSKGVALAIECREPFFADPCGDATAESDDPKVAAIFASHLEPSRETAFYPAFGGGLSSAARTGFVIAGVETGTTTIHIKSTDGNRTFVVIVPER